MIGYLLIVLPVRKSAHVWVGLCEHHNRRRMLGRTMFVGGPSLLFLTMIAAVQFHSDSIAIVSLAAIPICAVIAIIGWRLARVVWAARIEDNCAWLHVGRAFLETISTTPTTPSLYLAPEYVQGRIPIGAGAPTSAASSGPVRQAASVAYTEPSTAEQLAQQERKWGPKQSPAPDGESGERT
jgi:hypothetical protein